MRKIIFAAVGLLIGTATVAQTSADPADNKRALIHQIQNWVADREQIDPESVAVRALDRRLVVPDCEQHLSIDYAYSTAKHSVRVTCPAQPWKLFVGIDIKRSHPVWVYTRDIAANAPLQPTDIQLTSTSTSQKGLLSDPSELLDGNRHFSLATAVSAGDLVRDRHLVEAVNVLLLKRDILKGEAISTADIIHSQIALAVSQPHQRFPLRLLDRARALRDLAADSILSRRDFSIANPALVSLKPLIRGQKLDASNTHIADYFGDLPSDAALAQRDVEHMEITRNIPAGQLIRLSDLRPATLFYQGDSVQLTVSKGGLRLTVEMVALEDGRIDQQVDLLNPESQQTVTAVVTGPGSARGL